MQIRLLIILIWLLIPLSSCKSKYEDCTDQDYAQCNTRKPKTGMAEIEISFNSLHRNISVKMFKGNFEDGNLVWEKTVSNSFITERIDVEEYYSFTATYYVEGDTIVAVDGGEIKVNQYTICELTCYETKDFIVDLTFQ